LGGCAAGLFGNKARFETGWFVSECRKTECLIKKYINYETVYDRLEQVAGATKF
jgi:hypothetical protein